MADLIIMLIKKYGYNISFYIEGDLVTLQILAPNKRRWHRIYLTQELMLDNDVIFNYIEKCRQNEIDYDKRTLGI